MGEHSRISVALCTHNGAEFIEEQLRSILAQTVLPDEVVISDDASTDDTVARAQKLWSESVTINARPELRILHNSQALGVTKNFEQAILACHGELIALCDQDDRWHDHKIELLQKHFDANHSDLLVHTDAKLVDEHGASMAMLLSEGLGMTSSERAELKEGLSYRTFLRRNLATGATSMIRRSLMDIAAPFPEHWIHDEWLAVVAAATHRHKYLAEPLIDYRQHGKNQIGVQKLTTRDKWKKLVEPRGDRYAYLLARAEELYSALAASGDTVLPQDLGRARDKVVHHGVRAGLPASRWRRILPVLAEASTGRYSRYSRGAADVVRDLLQPR